jgi:hypothetical protein
MPRQNTGQVFTPAFNSIITADLLLSVLHSRVSTVSDAVAWLTAHNRDFERPVGAGSGITESEREPVRGTAR